MRRILQARHYQPPSAPVRRVADHAVPKLTRDFKKVLLAARRSFDPAYAARLIQAGLWTKVKDVVDWNHLHETLKHPLGQLGDVWLAGAAVGQNKLNGRFRQRRRLVRFKKGAASAHILERAGAGDISSRSFLDGSSTAAIIASEGYLASVVIDKDVTDQFNFDRYDPVTQAHIRAYQDALIKQLGEDSRGTIEAVVLRAMREAQTPDEIVEDIRAVIGLTPSQANAVLSYERMLKDMDPSVVNRALMGKGDQAVFQAAVDAGKPLTQAIIDQMVDNYADNYLTLRAQTIAQTEATRAASLGLQDSYLQAVARGALPAEAVTQHWQISLDERTCPICLGVIDANPDGVQLGDQFDSPDGPMDCPPAHPNCRCSLELVTNLDLVPDDYEA